VETVPRYPSWKSRERHVVLRTEAAVGFTRYLGTMKSEIPFTPGGDPGISPGQVDDVSARSWSPAEMKIFVPRSE